MGFFLSLKANLNLLKASVHSFKNPSLFLLVLKSQRGPCKNTGFYHPISYLYPVALSFVPWKQQKPGNQALGQYAVHFWFAD